MAKVLVPRFLLPPFQWERWVRNGLRPSWVTGYEAARRLLATVALHRKVHFIKCQPMNAIEASSASTVVPWRFTGHSGYADSNSALFLRFITVLVGPDTASTDPYAYWTLNDGSATNTEEMHLGAVVSGTVVPNDMRVFSTRLALTPAVNFTCELNLVDRCRAVAACVYQEHNLDVTVPTSPATTPTGVVDPREYFDGAMITDYQHAQLLQQSNNLWERNGAHIFSWSRDDHNGGQAISSATYTNLLDLTSTSVTANTPGFRPQLRYHHTQKSTNVPFTMRVFAQRTAGTNATNGVRLQTSSGTLAEATGWTGSASWITATGNFDGTQNTTKCDLQIKQDPGGDASTLTVYHVSVYEHKA